MMAAILNSTMLHSDTAILNSDTLLSSLRFTQKHSHSILTLTQTNSIWLKVIHSHLTWWWQPSCILPSWILISWILPFCSKLWLQLIQSDSKSFILTQLDDGSHLGFSHFAQQKLHSFILTQLDDGSHIEFWHIGSSHSAQKNFTHFFWLNLMIAAILNSAILNSTILDSTILVFLSNSLTLAKISSQHLHKKTSLIHSDSTWWLQLSWNLPSWIQPICTKRTSLIHSDSTWWWQPSWILPCWIQTLPSWIQTPCYLLSDSLKNTLPPIWLWLKLIPSD